MWPIMSTWLPLLCWLAGCDVSHGGLAKGQSATGRASADLLGPGSGVEISGVEGSGEGNLWRHGLNLDADLMLFLDRTCLNAEARRGQGGGSEGGGPQGGSVGSPCRALDVGCSDGFYADYLTKTSGRFVVGVGVGVGAEQARQAALPLGGVFLRRGGALQSSVNVFGYCNTRVASAGSNGATTEEPAAKGGCDEDLAAVVRGMGGPFHVVYSVGGALVDGRIPGERQVAAAFLFAAAAHPQGATLVIGSPLGAPGTKNGQRGGGGWGDNRLEPKAQAAHPTTLHPILAAAARQAEVVALFEGAGFTFQRLASAQAQRNVTRTAVLVFTRPPPAATDVSFPEELRAPSSRTATVNSALPAAATLTSPPPRWSKLGRRKKAHSGGDPRVVGFEHLLDQSVAGGGSPMQGQEGGTWTSQTHIMRYGLNVDAGLLSSLDRACGDLEADNASPATRQGGSTKGCKVLEFGCGVGVYSDYLATPGRTVVGMEPEPMGGVFEREGGAVQSTVRVLDYDTSKSSADRGYKQLVARLGGPFDLVFSIEVLEHIPYERHRDVVAFLFAAASKAPGSGRSRLVFSAATLTQPGTGHIGGRAVNNWRKMLERAGFTYSAVATAEFRGSVDRQNLNHARNLLVFDRPDQGVASAGSLLQGLRLDGLMDRLKPPAVGWLVLQPHRKHQQRRTAPLKVLTASYGFPVLQQVRRLSLLGVLAGSFALFAACAWLLRARCGFDLGDCCAA